MCRLRCSSNSVALWLLRAVAPAGEHSAEHALFRHWHADAAPLLYGYAARPWQRLDEIAVEWGCTLNDVEPSSVDALLDAVLAVALT